MTSRSYKKTEAWKDLRKWIWKTDLLPYITITIQGNISWNNPETILDKFGFEDPSGAMLTSLDNMLEHKYTDFLSTLKQAVYGNDY